MTLIKYNLPQRNQYYKAIKYKNLYTFVYADKGNYYSFLLKLIIVVKYNNMFRSIRLLVLLFFILCWSASSSQPYIGVFGGVNSSKLLGDMPEKAKYKSLMGANVGANIDIKLTNSIYLSFQPSYSQEGTKISYKVKGQEKPVDSVMIRLNYFSIPLFIKITTPNQRWYAIGGFEPGYLYDSFTKIGGEKGEIDANVTQWNLAMHFGAGIKFPIGFPRLFIEVRYSQGLVNLTDEPMEKSYIPRVKTTGFKLITGIEIPLKKSKQ